MAVRIKQGFLASLALIVIGLFVWGAASMMMAFGRALSSVSPTILTALIAAAGTVIVSVVSVSLSRYSETRIAVLKENREKKMPVYEKLIGFLFRIVYGSKLGQEPSYKEVLDFFASFTQEFMVWDADDVVKCYVAFRRHSLSAGKPAELVLLYEDLVRAIRKDLGHKNKGLRKGDILSIFVNDVETLLRKG